MNLESAGTPNIVSSLSTSHYMYGWMIRVFINIELRNEKVTNGSTPSRKYTFTRIIHDVYHMHPNSGRGRVVVVGLVDVDAAFHRMNTCASHIWYSTSNIRKE